MDPVLGTQIIPKLKRREKTEDQTKKCNRRKAHDFFFNLGSFSLIDPDPEPKTAALHWEEGGLPPCIRGDQCQNQIRSHP